VTDGLIARGIFGFEKGDKKERRFYTTIIRCMNAKINALIFRY
jgi:hypothetical protein